MTVLMFGWEFPPHISGGLGTACFGLASSLIDEDAHIFFVVPKAHGDESMKLISASEVVMKQAKEEVKTPEAPILHSESFIKINVASSLRAYTQAGVDVNTEMTQQWNWEFAPQITKATETAAGIRYEFSGKYGPSLRDEVSRYAEVASVIATQYSFELIHAHDWLTFPAGIEAKKVSGKPLVIHVHSTEFDRAGEAHIDPRVFEIEKKGMQEADTIIAVSQWTKDIIVNKYGISKEKVKVVHNGIISLEESDFSFLPKISDHVVTYLGRITYQKGPQYFIDAAQKVLQYFPDAHFIMGGSGDLLPAMIERVAQLGMSSRVHFTGFLKTNQVHRIWSVTDVYVMPSVSEPFGITPLEAVQAGVPVIVSNQSGVAEVMDHAIKVDFWNIDALADAIIGVLNHKSLSKSLAKNSREQLNTLTWRRAAKKINSVYNELQHQYTT